MIFFILHYKHKLFYLLCTVQGAFVANAKVFAGFSQCLISVHYLESTLLYTIIYLYFIILFFIIFIMHFRSLFAQIIPEGFLLGYLKHPNVTTQYLQPTQLCRLFLEYIAYVCTYMYMSLNVFAFVLVL